MSSDATSSFDRFVLGAVAATRRIVRSWRALPAKPRLAACAAFGLFIGLFLPWYSQTVVATGAKASVGARSVSLTGWDAFSLVQTIVLLVSIGVLVLLYERGDGRTFRLPGGDGGAIMVAGGATCILIVWGIFDRPGANGPGQYTTATGIQWGIFIVLGLAALLTYAGSKIRTATAPEPQPRRAQPRHATATDDATRVSNRRPYDQPTPVSNRREKPVDAPTRVSTRRPPSSDDEPTRRLGPKVVPDDPPTMKITRIRPSKPIRAEDLQRGRSTNEK
jgi:hypothetical protein